jgi:hypothetical protein
VFGNSGFRLFAVAQMFRQNPDFPISVKDFVARDIGYRSEYVNHTKFLQTGKDFAFFAVQVPEK